MKRKINIDENHITVRGWMVSKLKLKGSNLNTFALIYGFCQDRQSRFNGSLAYVQYWLGANSKGTAVNALKLLVSKELITKHQKNIGGLTLNEYSVNFKKVDRILKGIEKLNGIPKNGTPIPKNGTGGIPKNGTNSIFNKIEDNIGVKGSTPKINSNSNGDLKKGIDPTIKTPVFHLKEIFESRFPQYPYDNEIDGKHLSKLLGRINKAVANDKKHNEKILGYNVTLDDKKAGLKKVLDNLNSWHIQNLSIDLICREFAKLWIQGTAEKPNLKFLPNSITKAKDYQRFLKQLTKETKEYLVKKSSHSTYNGAYLPFKKVWDSKTDIEKREYLNKVKRQKERAAVYYN